MQNNAPHKLSQIVIFITKKEPRYLRGSKLEYIMLRNYFFNKSLISVNNSS